MRPQIPSASSRHLRLQNDHWDPIKSTKVQTGSYELEHIWSLPPLFHNIFLFFQKHRRWICFDQEERIFRLS